MATHFIFIITICDYKKQVIAWVVYTIHCRPGLNSCGFSDVELPFPAVLGCMANTKILYTGIFNPLVLHFSSRIMYQQHVKHFSGMLITSKDNWQLFFSADLEFP